MVFMGWRKRREVRRQLEDALSELSIEEVLAQRFHHFFERLGSYEMTGIHHTVMAQVEKPLLRLALEWSEGNQQKAARLLGINRNTLRKKIREFNIDK